MNNPERYNALDRQMRVELKTLLEKVAKNEKVRAVVIQGTGKAFAAGADLKELLKMNVVEVSKFSDELGLTTLCRIIRDMPKPVIAAVHGYCLGGGFELAMGCDIVIADESAVFGHPEINIGLIPGGGGSQRLPRLIGEKKSKEMIFTGDRYSAKDMLEMGAINKVVPEDKLLDAVNELLAKIKSKSPVAIAAAKKAVNAALSMKLDEGCNYEKEIFAKLFATEDCKEGIKAFLEKRKPEWKGR